MNTLGPLLRYSCSPHEGYLIMLAFVGCSTLRFGYDTHDEQLLVRADSWEELELLRGELHASK